MLESECSNSVALTNLFYWIFFYSDISCGTKHINAILVQGISSGKGTNKYGSSWHIYVKQKLQ